MNQSTHVRCALCGGRGKVRRGRDICPGCGGTGSFRRLHVLLKVIAGRAIAPGFAFERIAITRVEPGAASELRVSGYLDGGVGASVVVDREWLAERPYRTFVEVGEEW